jgi:ATPase subunit of ABC transporter with duplicated ATPase domains
MIVGSAGTGKTTLLKMTISVAKYLHKTEFSKKQRSFLRRKALKMDVPFTEEPNSDKIILKTDNPILRDKFLPTQEEIDLL